MVTRPGAPPPEYPPPRSSAVESSSSTSPCPPGPISTAGSIPPARHRTSGQSRGPCHNPGSRLCPRLSCPDPERREGTMSLEHPAYWVIYVPESTEDGPAEVAAVAPDILPARLLGSDARGLLDQAERYHETH